MRRSSRAVAAALAAVLAAVTAAAGAPQATPQRGGTVLYAQSQPEPACLNMFDRRCAPGSAAFVLGSITARVLESPFDVAPDFTWRPRLVSRVEFTRKPPFTLTYHIRPEARWSDGVPITGQDFLFTHEAIVEHSAPDAMERTEVRSVRAVDAKTVKVVLRSRLAGWRGLFGSILPQHALRGEDLATVWKDRIENPKTGRPIGSGPFLVERWDRGRQLTLVRNPRYWGPHPAYLDRIVVRFGVDGAELAEEFRKGQLDVVARFAPGSFPSLRQLPGVKTVPMPSSSFDHFELRIGPGGHPALRNRLVRRALAFGIDRGLMTRAVPGEIDPTARPLESAVFTKSSRYYRPNWSVYRYRPTEARRLLEQAGCRRGADGVFACAGERLSLRFATPVIVGGLRPEVIRLAQSQLRQVGIEVVPVFAAPPVFFNQILPKGDFDAVLLGLGAGPAPTPKPLFGCGGPLNSMGYCQRLVTRELDQADRILDVGEQARVLNRVDVQLAKDVPLIPLYEQPQWGGLRSSVRGFAPSAVDPLTNAENWWLAR
jgi:ABC-type transport system substrate-binding protein